MAPDFFENAAKRHMTTWSREPTADIALLMGFLFAFADTVALVIGVMVATLTVLGTILLEVNYRTGALLFALLTYLIFSKLNLYGSWRGRSYLDQVRMVSIGWFATFLSAVMLAFLLGATPDISRTWLIVLAFTGWTVDISLRISIMGLVRVMRRRGWNEKKLVVLGAGKWGRETIKRLNSASWFGMDVECVLDHDAALHGTEIDGVPVKGGYELLPGMIQKGLIDEVWICLPLQSGGVEQAHMDKITNILRHSTITQRLVPNLAELQLINQRVIEVMGLPVININTSPMHGLSRVVKELEDRILAFVIVVLTSPVMIGIALAIKLTSRGPVLFKQMRHGWDGVPINVYKFRTMYIHKEAAGKVTQARRNDSRITPIGRFLRRSSMDELPQFYNVLQGKMSVVGPRPHAIAHNEYFMNQIDSYMQRHKVKPGITGWAQINGLRGQTDTLEKMQRRVEHDLYYIQNWSLWFDLKIVIRTIFQGLKHKNAY